MNRDEAIRKQLLRHMSTELIAARALFMDGLQEQAACHLMASWHVLSILQASQQGAPSPPASDFSLDFNQLPISSRVQKAGAAFTDSYEVTRQLAARTELTRESLDQMASGPEPTIKERRRQRKQLELQFRMVELAYHKLILAKRLSWLRKHVFNKKVLLAAGACLLILAVGGLIQMTGFTLKKKPSVSKKPRPRLQKKVTHHPPRGKGDKNLSLSISKLQTVMKDNLPWNEYPAYIFKTWVKVDLEKVYKAKKVTISLDNNDQYELAFQMDGKELGKISLPPIKADGLKSRTVAVPEKIAAAGYDMVVLTALKGDTRYSVGHLIFSD